jgi:hypothetical protein
MLEPTMKAKCVNQIISLNFQNPAGSTVIIVRVPSIKI